MAIRSWLAWTPAGKSHVLFAGLQLPCWEAMPVAPTLRAQPECTYQRYRAMTRNTALACG